MTARNYNFTKQSGVVFKAKKRFTKQNGVVKQIFAGWTKQNGVVEKVYSFGTMDGFSKFFWLGEGVNAIEVMYVDDDKMVYYLDQTVAGTRTQSSYVKEDWNSTSVLTAVSPAFLSPHGFNYAGGTTSSQSVLSSGSTTASELPLADPTNAINNIGPAFITTDSAVGTIKVDGTSYAVFRMFQTRIEYTVYYSGGHSGFTIVLGGGAYNSIGQALTLSNGHGICVCCVTNTNVLSSLDTYSVYVVDYEYGTGCTNTLAFAVSRNDLSTVYSGINLRHTQVYTTNGQDCFFTVLWTSTEIGWGGARSFVCKYNTQSKTANYVEKTDMQVGIGTYGGCFYTIMSGASISNDIYLRVLKYDSNLQLVGYHDIPTPTTTETVTTLTPSDLENCGKTNSSDNRYAVLSFARGQNSADGSYICVIDLESF